MPSYTFSDDNGYPFAKMGGHKVMQEDTVRVLSKVCENSLKLWKEHPERRQEIVQHIFFEHGIANHHQHGEVATVFEMDNLVRQLRGKEKSAGVIYQRQEYQPD